MGNTSSSKKRQQYQVAPTKKKSKAPKCVAAVQACCLGCLEHVLPNKSSPRTPFLHKQLEDERNGPLNKPISSISMHNMQKVDTRTALKEHSPTHMENQDQLPSIDSEDRTHLSKPEVESKREEVREQVQSSEPEPEEPKPVAVHEVPERLDQEVKVLTLEKIYESTEDAQRREWLHTAIEGLAKAAEINTGGIEGYERIYNETKATHKLQCHFRSYTTPWSSKVNVTKSEWYVYCSPEEFIKYVYNSEEQRKVDKGIEIDKIIEKVIDTEEEYCSINYLGYKKVWITAARDFTYIKHYKKINETTWSDCSRSVEMPDYPVVEGKVRAGMVLVGHYIERDDDPVTGQVRSRVRHYSEIDVKINTPDLLAKPFVASTMRKTVDDIDKRIKELYGQK